MGLISNGVKEIGRAMTSIPIDLFAIHRPISNILGRVCRDRLNLGESLKLRVFSNLPTKCQKENELWLIVEVHDLNHGM